VTLKCSQTTACILLGLHTPSTGRFEWIYILHYTELRAKPPLCYTLCAVTGAIWAALPLVRKTRFSAPVAACFMPPSYSAIENWSTRQFCVHFQLIAEQEDDYDIFFTTSNLNGTV